ncbi:MAG: hypothetical protein WC895_02440 [Candidatus Shapirobacteria bacterium]|jgi:hypothetical protein
MSIFDLTISPSQIEFILKPGITITQAYEITNNSNQEISLNTEVLPFLPQGNNGSVVYANLSQNPNILFSLNNSDLALGQPFTIAGHTKKQIVLKIKTSANTSLSDYYSTFFVYQNQNLSNNESTFAQANGKIGSHILLSVANQENPKALGQIEKFSITPKIKDIFFTPINFSAQVQNQTNYFFKTSGQITITKDNKTIKELKLDSQNVLANYYRRLICQDQNICTISPPLWPGKYIATLSFDSNLNIKSTSVSFFVLPISPLLFLILTVGIIFILKRSRKYW